MIDRWIDRQKKTDRHRDSQIEYRSGQTKIPIGGYKDYHVYLFSYLREHVDKKTER